MQLPAYHSHSNGRSEPHLQPTPQLVASWISQGSNLHPHRHYVRFLTPRLRFQNQTYGYQRGNCGWGEGYIARIGLTHTHDYILYINYTPIQIFFKSTNNKCWRRCGEKGTFLHCQWECKLVQPLWKTVWSFPKQLKIELLEFPSWRSG